MNYRNSSWASLLDSSKNASDNMSPMNGGDSKGGLDCGDRNHPSAYSKMVGDGSYRGNLEGLDVVIEENVGHRIPPVGPGKKTDAMNDDSGVDGNSVFVFRSRRNITSLENLFPGFPPNMTFYATKGISKAHARMKKESEKIRASSCALQKPADFSPGVGISSPYTSNFNKSRFNFAQEIKNSSTSIIQKNKSIPGEYGNELHRAISKENPQLPSTLKKSAPTLHISPHIDETEKKTKHVPFVSQTEERISDKKREAGTELPSITDAATSVAAQEICERYRLR